MRWMSTVIAHHPFVIIIAVIVFSLACIIIPLTTVKFPDFNDPQLGFETRGTEIANRLVAWDNLQDAINLVSGPLTVNPELSKKIREDNERYQRGKVGHEKEPKRNTGNEIMPVKVEVPSNISFVIEPRRNNSDDEADEWVSLKNELYERPHDHDHLSSDQFFCSQPGSNYGRVVMSSIDGSDLFNKNSLLTMCWLEAGLISRNEYSSICESISANRCCRSWSLPNYVAMLNNRTSCLNITEGDVRRTKKLLNNCLKYIKDFYILPETISMPSECSKHNAIYNMKHFILDYAYVNSSYPLKNVMVILPIARSSKSLDYYSSLTTAHLELGHIKITAIDFGVKNALFDEYLLRDIKLIALGAVFVLLCICLYTSSIFLTFTTLLGIIFSLGIAYFAYTLIFKITFFPFMNLLAVIVAVGIGGDASLMVEKVWVCAKEGGAPLKKVVTSVLDHSFLCMLVTTITTALAFFSSFVSSITAISCFSIFAGSTVVAIFLVTTLWAPACLIVNERVPQIIKLPKLPDIRSTLTLAVLKFRWIWIILFLLISMMAVAIVIHSSAWKFPDSPGLQLFDSSHPFEQYDSIYRNHFWFDRVLRSDFDWTNHNIKMPMRFVWGVLPVDNGEHLDPASKGKLRYDPEFDLANPDSQTWLMSFCTKLRGQEFYQPSIGPLLPNCFLEMYSNWMERKCADPIDGLSRAPCCETASFPYERKVFTECANKAAAALYRTPAYIATPGVAGPKFPVNKAKNPRIKVYVVEYDSNYTLTTSYKEMDQFFNQIESWSSKEMNSAPAGMRNGWFVSYLSLYDLQMSLYSGTFSAIAISLCASFGVVAASTLNVVLSIAAALTITSIISVTIAVLVLMGWKLNLLEAVSVSLTIGLAVDFTLQYIINYRSSPEKGSRDNCVSYALSMMSGPTFMAALTTAGAGAFMIPSIILPYHQIGLLMVVLMVVSWLYSSFFLMALLSVIGPVGSGRGDYSATELGTLRGGRRKAEHSPSATSATTIVEGESMLHPT